MDQWEQMLKRFNEWGSPLRPCWEDVKMYKNQLRADDRTLLLGVTPELRPLADVAVDNNPQAVELFKAKAILADWADLPFENSFDAVIGDGCLTAFQGTPEKFFAQMKKVLKPGGRLILRLFIAPETREKLENILVEKELQGFHVFKWKVAHSLANPYVKVKDLYRAIQPVWDHPTLSVYEHSDLIYYFPKLSELPPWQHIQFGKSYELAELCPVITWRLSE